MPWLKPGILVGALAPLAAILAVVHFVWRVKKDIREPMTYGLIVAALLLVRAVAALRRRLEDRHAAGARAGLDSLAR